MGVFHDMFDRTVAEMFSVPRLGPQLDIRQAAREDAVICSRAVGRHFTIVTVIALTLIVLSGCSTAALVPQQLHPKWIKNRGLPTALVFVHGMSGDGTSTWTNPTTEAYFPKLVADDPEFHVDLRVRGAAAARRRKDRAATNSEEAPQRREC